jgi:hypothetical protein
MTLMLAELSDICWIKTEPISKLQTNDKQAETDSPIGE